MILPSVFRHTTRQSAAVARRARNRKARATRLHFFFSPPCNTVTVTASAQSPGLPPLPLEALPARGWRHRRRRHALVSPKGSHSRPLSPATSTLLRRLGHHNPDTTSSSKPMHSQPLIAWGCVQTQESCRRKCWRVLLMWTPIETNAPGCCGR